MSSDLFIEWNPWHGCTKISPGCKYCYVYRQDEMYGSQTASSECRKTLAYNLPIKKKRDGSYKIPSGKMIFTCFTSDFLLKDADEWRSECWLMIRERQDCLFYFFTKRIDRFCDCIPDDWGDGYENVLVGCTVENQTMADYRLPIFLEAPIKHKSITMAPLLEKIDISNYLNETIDNVFSYRKFETDWKGDVAHNEGYDEIYNTDGTLLATINYSFDAETNTWVVVEE